MELLKYHSQDVERVLIHSSFNNEQVIMDIKKNLPSFVRIEVNDKLINKLSDKGNCYVIGIFRKYKCTLSMNEHHLLLDNPSDMGNLGTIMRSSLGFGIKNIAIIRPGVDIFNPKAVRATMGALFAINVEYFDSFEDYKEKYGNHKFYSFMLQAKTSLQNAHFDEELTTLIFGNEATGLDKKYLSENSLIINHSHDIDSLNLPTAVGIALYEFKKQVK
ncbi:MAG: TrmH family RNA methyltransferase [Bacilli bacterium]|nr:TrmH family RNA methyltransferase [Bacilli bacterium]